MMRPILHPRKPFLLFDSFIQSIINPFFHWLDQGLIWAFYHSYSCFNLVNGFLAFSFRVYISWLRLCRKFTHLLYFSLLSLYFARFLLWLGANCFRPKSIYKDPDDGRQRFLLELEFVQCLANPTYIHCKRMKKLHAFAWVFALHQIFKGLNPSYASSKLKANCFSEYFLLYLPVIFFFLEWFYILHPRENLFVCIMHTCVGFLLLGVLATHITVWRSVSACIFGCLCTCSAQVSTFIRCLMVGSIFFWM